MKVAWAWVAAAATNEQSSRRWVGLRAGAGAASRPHTMPACACGAAAVGRAGAWRGL